MISLELPEWSRIGPDEHDNLRGLRLTGDGARKVARRLSSSRLLDIRANDEGLVVRSFSHVGRIELDDLTVTVRPKLAANSLLPLLRYAYSLRDLRLVDQARFDPGAQALQDLLVAQLESGARALLRRGAARRYVRRAEALGSPRGRVEVGQLAVRQRPASATVPCTYYVRSTDSLLNQVVLSGLRLARALSIGHALRRAVAQVETEFAELATPIHLTSNILQRARTSLDRLTAEYAPIVRLVELLYASSSLDLGAPANGVHVRGFLFDMNRFFQTLIGKFLGESLPQYQVSEEVSLHGMMKFAPGFNPRGRRAPCPRPDFVVSRGARRFLLDAKYRDLWRTELPREMLYQLATYAMSQPFGATAAILYPTDDPTAREAIVDICDPMSDAIRAHVSLRPVVVPRLLTLIQDGRSLERERQVLAEALVLGARERGPPDVSRNGDCSASR